MEFAYGVDLSWVSQFEKNGMIWVDEEGRQKDPVLLAKEKGANAVRLRIFVNPPQDFMWKKNQDTRCQLGFCDAEHVLVMAKRAQKENMRIMLDFHYSDHFADPQYQDIPEAWKNKTAEQLGEEIYLYTTNVLKFMKENGIRPEWIQVGNEINMGLMIPEGSLDENPENMTRFLNCGYEAVKNVFPECQVITHLTAFHKAQYIEKFFDSFFTNGGKTDVLGFSHYPYWFNLYAREESDKVYPTADFVYKHMMYYSRKYKKPVMICEIGEHEEEEEKTYQLLANTIEGLKTMPDNAGLGVFYWEPEANSRVLPDGYILGASRYLGSNKLQYTKALDAFKNNQ